MSGIVVVLGNLPVERSWFERLAKQNGWSFERAENLSRLQSLGAAKIVGVLFDPKDVHQDWRHALKAVAHAAPRALPIICRRFSEGVHGPEIGEPGAFHLLHYPFAMDEVRQSLGFAREAQRRRQLVAAHAG